MELKVKSLLNLFFNELDFELVSTQILKDGLIHQTLLIEIERNTKKEKYILQKINQSVFPDPTIITKNMELVTAHLKMRLYPFSVVEIVKSKAGKSLVIDPQQNQWRLTIYIDETECFTKIKSASHAYEAAKIFSVFHAYLIDFDANKLTSPIKDFINFENRMIEFETAVENASEELKINASTELAFLVENKNLPKKFIEHQKKNKFPKRVIHADPKISNVLFHRNSNLAKCIIDLDTLMPGSILYDYGDMVRSYTNNREEDDPNPENVFNFENYKAITEGFLSALQEYLTPIEKDNLAYSAKVVVYIQAIRFFTDYLNGNKYYATTFPSQNLCRAKNQINLLKEILELDCLDWV